MFGDDKCSRVCLGVSAVFGLLIAVLAYWKADFNMVISLVLGLLGFGVGYWLLKMMFCGESGEGQLSKSTEVTRTATPPQAAPVAAVTPVSAASASPSSEASAASDKVADADGASANWTDSVSADSGKAGDSRGATGLKPSVVLGDEETLRDGVGSWKYGGAAKVTDAQAAATAPAAASTLEGDYDGDGVVEGVHEGEKPATLTEARDGGADDLKQIKGVGPKMEGLLNSLGFFHFDQVAGWSDQEVAWVDANLEGFRGRVSRDNWVDQAKVLASGGETEFSKRVEDGGVY